ncbi:MAG: CopG family transcriptional regulator [Candidatus Omnitrophota bacterium]
MKKEIKDQNMPIGKLSRVNDFLPPPDKLVMPQETMKVTLSLTKTSVEFFKQQAKLNHTQYQKMIRQLIDQYTIHYSH